MDEQILALLEATDAADIPCVRRLLLAGTPSEEPVSTAFRDSLPPEYHQRSWIYSSPFEWAIRMANAELITVFLEHGANPNHCQGGREKKPSLAWLCEQDHYEAFVALLRFGADPGLRGDSESALSLVVGKKDIRYVQELMRHGASVYDLFRFSVADRWGPGADLAIECGLPLVDALTVAIGGVDPFALRYACRATIRRLMRR